MAIYLNDWSVDDPLAALCEDFGITTDDLAGKEILVASYTAEDYSGDAYVLLAGDDGKIYEVVGSHCSCFGLENQWSPEETSTAALRHRLEHGCIGLRSEPGLELAVSAVLTWLERERERRGARWRKTSDSPVSPGERTDKESSTAVSLDAASLRSDSRNRASQP